MATKTYYEVLDIEPTATAQEIKRAARLQRAAWHPDKFSGAHKKEAEERTKEINAAYDVLKDPQKRTAYDSKLADQQRRAEGKQRAEETRRRYEEERWQQEQQRAKEERRRKQAEEERRRQEKARHQQQAWRRSDEDIAVVERYQQAQAAQNANRHEGDLANNLATPRLSRDWQNGFPP